MEMPAALRREVKRVYRLGNPDVRLSDKTWWSLARHAARKGLLDLDGLNDQLSDNAQRTMKDIFEKGATMNTQRHAVDQDGNRITPTQLLVRSSPNELGEDNPNQTRTGRTILKHVRTGLPVMMPDGQPAVASTPNERGMFGAWLKYKARRSGIDCQWDQEDERYLEACWGVPWHGQMGGMFYDSVPGSRVKASLLDDATSGGQEISPYFFDNMIITKPLLHSELLPFVDVRNVPKGSSVQSAIVSNPTLSWGTPEGTALTVFDATALIADLSSTVWPLMFTVDIGRDLLDDSPVAVGQVLEDLLGQSFLSELDRVIAAGSGSSRPTGITVASGTTAVLSQNGPGGPVTIADAENLLFSVGKQYRQQNWNPAYLMNDVAYMRLRQVPTGPADQRRVFGMDHQRYTVFDYPVRISSALANSVMAFGCLRRYILWRRAGMATQFFREGRTLALSNQVTLVCRGRFAGKVGDPAAFAVMSNLPA
jgi:HK97 family phage major capsid protein